MDDKKYSCFKVIPAPCVPYEGDIPEWSGLYGKDGCVTVADAIGDIYKELTRIRESIDLRDIGSRCVSLNGEKTVAKAIYAIENFICDKT